MRIPLRPGRYHVWAKLVNKDLDTFPAPLFWKPYDHPVVAETQIVVE